MFDSNHVQNDCIYQTGGSNPQLNIYLTVFNLSTQNHVCCFEVLNLNNLENQVSHYRKLFMISFFMIKIKNI
jgi:hypothetical protein